MVCFPAHNAARLGFTIASSNRNIATQSLYEMASVLPVNRQNIFPPFLGHRFVVVEEEGEWFFHIVGSMVIPAWIVNAFFQITLSFFAQMRTSIAWVILVPQGAVYSIGVSGKYGETTFSPSKRTSKRSPAMQRFNFI